MSKNTQISELINYISVDGSGNIVFTTIPTAATNTGKFLVSDAGVLKFRTAAQLLSDIGAQASGSYQPALSGTGFVKISGSTISYDNSTYLTTSVASSTYLPLTGGTLAFSPASTTANVLTIKNTVATGNDFVSSVLALDTTAIGAVADIRLGSTNPLGIRIYASNAPLTVTPTGAGFQMFTNASPSLPGHMYFDSGAHNSAALNFRTAVTGGNITTRLRIEANGTIKLSMLTSNGFVKTGSSDGSLSIDTNTYLTTSSASSTYVPYTGATTDLVLGANNFSSKRVSVLKSSDGFGGFTSNYLFLQTGSSTTGVGSDGISLFSKPNTRALVINYDIGGTNYSATLDASLLTNSRTYNIPDASGTFALTSNLSSYLLLAGGTLTGSLVVPSPFTIKDTNPYIQWQNSSGTRLGYIQHATNLVMSADTGSVILTTTSGTFTLTSTGAATFNSSVQATDFRYTNTGYITYDTANTGSESLIIRKFGTPVLTLDSISRATFASTVFIGGNLHFDTNGTVRTISNYGYGGSLQLLRSDSTSTRWARIGMVDATGTNFIGGMTINNDTSATFSSNITTTGTIIINSRTVYTTAAIYDNASAGNNVGIGFGPNSILPITGDGTASNGTKDLGSSSVRWSTVYTSDLSLSNGIGDYTIVEGENDLFLYNNKQNKVYKFMLAEVDPAYATPKKS